MLAPFHQEDGAPPDGAIFDRLLDATEGRRAHGFVLDVGISWEGDSVVPGGDDSRDLDAHIGDLWGVVDGARGKETTSWFVLGKHVGHNFEFNDGRAGGCSRQPMPGRRGSMSDSCPPPAARGLRRGRATPRISPAPPFAIEGLVMAGLAESMRRQMAAVARQGQTGLLGTFR